MTSKQIQENADLYRFSAASEAGWLREIAYQLAVMNERVASQDLAKEEAYQAHIKAMIATMGGMYPPPADYGA